MAWQRGWYRFQGAALDKDLRAQRQLVDKNRQAFLWGAVPHSTSRPYAVSQADNIVTLPQSLDALIAERVAFLTDYQDAAYSERYRSLVARVRAAELPWAAPR